MGAVPPTRIKIVATQHYCRKVATILILTRLPHKNSVVLAGALYFVVDSFQQIGLTSSQMRRTQTKLPRTQHF